MLIHVFFPGPYLVQSTCFADVLLMSWKKKLIFLEAYINRVSACTFKHLGLLKAILNSLASLLYSLYNMNLENCQCLGSMNSRTWSGYERVSYDPLVCVNECVKKLKKTLWRKIKREKRRIFRSSPVFHVPYDTCSYLQNFDDGYDSTDPDNVSRSFSARFAVPSKSFEKNEVMCS